MPAPPAPTRGIPLWPGGEGAGAGAEAAPGEGGGGWATGEAPAGAAEPGRDGSAGRDGQAAVKRRRAEGAGGGGGRRSPRPPRRCPPRTGGRGRRETGSGRAADTAGRDAGCGAERAAGGGRSPEGSATAGLICHSVTLMGLIKTLTRLGWQVAPRLSALEVVCRAAGCTRQRTHSQRLPLLNLTPAGQTMAAQQQLQKKGRMGREKTLGDSL
ncbi:spidroin-1-like isoform X2 [Columba livia]|uniref:spidroin-1-like isoform X2 n=1 Tax=Columba livia TaxID=8932 RepID=UPI0031BA5AD3